ncbi:transporter suffix domain-containing protein [Pasteurella skyensis]|uniref:Transporter suffix domain-containing protein n=1 Tax=Phocoenobacter skyensis TaxID=97481 RepID=A0AAJ6NAQ4_9PAST|nr:transporter suffix domain-containing protein [Pasteurella skyensis]MDP8163212.1 transporter suffix domain-containing protein [Pasteurella skyensis]MDP8173321.1 transporter suffix domain-containing protein [Pasteurella skyensis]MDP8176974.1 transporter suffix domain-containing protein [Pasteurella skyensis]MDP8179731.1 transporter suffix domain-containing protein [Pasteurella skyensis]MDP8182676.1 transporter suffix domain-containing protein [Pasteurella skyensis]
MKKTLGYLLFVLSFVAWGVIALLPFLEITKVQIASFTTMLIIAGEVFFWLSLLFLGKDFISKIKVFFTRKKDLIS